MWKNGKPDGNGVFTENAIITSRSAQKWSWKIHGKMVTRMMGIGMKINGCKSSITGQEKVSFDGHLKKVNLLILKYAPSRKSKRVSKVIT